MRALFAWSFDGVMPTRLAAVNERTHMPLVALAVCSVFAVAATIWAVYSSNFFTVLSTAALLAFPAIFLVSLSAIVLPYRRPDILRGTPGMIRVAGIPILSVLGGLSTIAILFLAWTLVTYTGLGIQPNPRPTIIVTLAIPVAGAVLYFIATAIRRSQGVDITLATKEIPPE
jgi:amino acid transporter